MICNRRGLSCQCFVVCSSVALFIARIHATLKTICYSSLHLIGHLIFFSSFKCGRFAIFCFEKTRKTEKFPDKIARIFYLSRSLHVLLIEIVAIFFYASVQVGKVLCSRLLKLSFIPSLTVHDYLYKLLSLHLG